MRIIDVSNFLERKWRTIQLQNIMVGTETAASSLSPFMKLARYFIFVGFERYVTEKSEEYTESSLTKMTDLKAQAWSFLDKSYLKELNFPTDIMRRNMSYDDIWEVHGAELRKWRAENIDNNTSIPSTEKTVLKKAMTLMGKGGESTNSGMYGLSKACWAVDDHLGSIVDKVALNTDSEGGEDDVSSSVKSIQDALKSVVKKITQKIGFTIPADVLKKLKEQDTAQDLVSSYRKLKRSLTELRNAEMRKFSLSGPVPADAMFKHLKSLGFEGVDLVRIKDGFDGLVGFDAGKLQQYTPEGKPLNVTIAPGSKVEKNPNYSPEDDSSYVYKFVAPNGVATNRAYTVERVASQTQSKFKRVEDSASNIKSMLKTWKRDLSNPDELKRMCAAITYIMYLTGGRVGSSKNVRAVKSNVQAFGISSLLVKHVRITGNKIIFSYTGKKGQAQKHTIDVNNAHTKRLKKIIEELKALGKPSSNLWTYELKSSTKRKPVAYAAINSYTKTTGLQKIHSLRHVRGNEIVNQMLDSVPFKVSAKGKKSLAAKQREAEAYIRDKVITPAGKQLGHQSHSGGKTKTAWRTTLGSYINPAIIQNWFVEQDLEVPKWAKAKGT